MNMMQETSRIVYLIEDDEEVRASIDWSLSSLDYRVEAYSDAETFLDCFNPNEPSCLVVDLLLPGMTGIGLCKKMNEINSCCKIVMISGHGDVGSAVEAMKLGAIDFIEKPCSRQQLMSAVNRALDQSFCICKKLIEEEDIARRGAIAKGLLTKQIAADLKISSKTVDVHRSKIIRKLGYESPAQLAHLISVMKRIEARKNH